jgi:putative oxidoreductase
MTRNHVSVPTSHRLANAWWALALRVVVGYGFMAHGFAKLSRGPDAFAATLHALGVPMPDVMAWSTIVVELLGGFAVLVGAFVWLASIPMIVVMLVAMLTVHLRYGFSSIKLTAVTATGPQFGPPGYEVNLLYIACLVALALGGSGPLSVDALLHQPTVRKEPRRARTRAREESVN